MVFATRGVQHFFQSHKNYQKWPPNINQNASKKASKNHPKTKKTKPKNITKNRWKFLLEMERAPGISPEITRQFLAISWTFQGNFNILEYRTILSFVQKLQKLQNQVQEPKGKKSIRMVLFTYWWNLLTKSTIGMVLFSTTFTPSMLMSLVFLFILLIWWNLLLDISIIVHILYLMD